MNAPQCAGPGLRSSPVGRRPRVSTGYRASETAGMLFQCARLLRLLLAAPACGLTGAAACGVVSGAATVQGIAPRGEIVLADGRHARLRRALAQPRGRGRARGARGTAPPDSPCSTASRTAGGASSSISSIATANRWRSTSSCAASPSCGRNRKRAPARPSGCRRRTAARAAGEGVWASPGAILNAADLAALASADGRFALVEGVVRRVGGARAKDYLDFAGREGFSVVIRKKAEAQFRRAGVDLKALAGQRVLVRGVVDARFGPRIEIADPLMIEPLDR